jgi:two-component system, NarL family, response regulator LiaR
MIRIVLETHADLIEVVGEASDGEAAVAQAELYPIDLVLMDIHLSQTNSTDATKQMRKLLPQMVIVGIASEYSPLLYNAMIAAGAVAFVRTEDAADLLFKTIVFAMCTYHPAHVQGIPVHAAAV